MRVASFTATELRWLRDHESENAARIAAVCLPHEWLTWRLRGYGRDHVVEREQSVSEHLPGAQLDLAQEQRVQAREPGRALRHDEGAVEDDVGAG